MAVSFRSFRTFQWFRFVVLGFSTCPRSTLNKYTGRLSTRVHRQPTNILAERPLMSVNIATKISLIALLPGVKGRIVPKLYCRPTVGRQSADSRPTVGRLLANCRPKDGQQSANSRPTDGQPFALCLRPKCWPTLGRQSVTC